MPRLRLVLVEDDPSLRLLLRTVLEQSGRFDVVGEAADGHEAVDAVRRARPELVLLDLMMPYRDGREALPLIRQAWPHARVIVHSMLEDPGLPEQVKQLGAHAWLDKGVSNEAFVSTLLATAQDSPSPGAGVLGR